MVGLNDIIGFGAKAADGLLTGGAIGRSQRRGKFADMVEAGDLQGAQQFATRYGRDDLAQNLQAQQASAAAAAKKEQDAEFQMIVNQASVLDSLVTDPIKQKTYLDTNIPHYLEQGLIGEEDVPLLYNNIGVEGGFTGLARALTDHNDQFDNRVNEINAGTSRMNALKPSGPAVVVNTGDPNAATAPPLRRPGNTAEPLGFDAIQEASGPLDTISRVARRIPLLAPIMGEAGSDERKARLVMENINNDLRKAFAVNGSRISNFDLQLAERMLPATLGVFTSEQASVSDLVELQGLIDQEINQQLEGSKTLELTKADRSDMQQGINSLASASDRIGAILTARQLSVTKINGTSVGDLDRQQLQALAANPEGLSDEQLQALAAAWELGE